MASLAICSPSWANPSSIFSSASFSWIGLPTWPSSVVIRTAVSWSRDWFTVAIIPLFIRALIRSEDFTESPLASSATEIVSGIDISFWINSEGFSNFWTDASWDSKNFSPSCSFLSSFESLAGLFRSFLWVLVDFFAEVLPLLCFACSCFVFLITLVEESFILFSLSSSWAFLSLDAWTLLFSAASKSIVPDKSPDELFSLADWFSDLNLVIEICPSSFLVSVFVFLAIEIVFLEPFLVLLICSRIFFLSSVEILSLADDWDRPAWFIASNNESTSYPMTFAKSLTSIFFIPQTNQILHP